MWQVTRFLRISVWTTLIVQALIFAPVCTDKGAAMAADTSDVASDDDGFAAWRQAFRTRALAAGIPGSVFDAAYRDVKLNTRVLELDRSQSEFTKTVGEYIEQTVPQARIAAGKRMAKRHKTVLADIERLFGVDGRVVLGIWGIETNFGGFMGGIGVIESLSTLAFDGRRRAWAERELITALGILAKGDTQATEMEGSWAGAMGHTQFMPTSYEAYAVDLTGDGRRDVWSDDPSDALASTANYLAVHGWIYGQPWGVEVKLPDRFDFSTANIKPGRPVSYWHTVGVRQIDGSKIPNYGHAGLWLPQGARGPAFAIFHNFYVITRYNRANVYALAVAHLGDRIYGGAKIATKWPPAERPLSRAEKRRMQQMLTDRGHDTFGADGLVGPNTIAAIRAFQREQGLTPDGHPSLDLLRRLQ